jgi:hypothetical protein
VSTDKALWERIAAYGKDKSHPQSKTSADIKEIGEYNNKVKETVQNVQHGGIAQTSNGHDISAKRKYSFSICTRHS